jgi:lysozyme
MIIYDLSHYQTKIDWDKIKSPTILKCSESLTYLDPTFKERREILRKKGLYLGCYHFFRDVDPIKQADFFLSHGHKPGELLILDFEINCENPVEKCKQFLDRVGSKWIYTNDARALKYSWPCDWKFWIARYADYTGKFYPDFKPKFCGWKIHQYTSRGKVNGIVGNVDMNYTPLSLLELTQITQPGANSSPTGHSNMKYYSQNDPAWKYDHLGNSTLTVGDYGCTTSCICALASWFGDKITPKMLAESKNCYTNSGLIIWQQLETVFKHIKFRYRYYHFNEEIIDDALKNPATAVLLQVNNGKHWVSALAKSKTGYKCSNPYPYPAKTQVYKNNSITGFTVLQEK